MDEQGTVGPVFTQRLHMHLNGGSKYSVLEYDVFRDGQRTGIRRVKRTNGSPKYLIEVDVFSAGDEEFDVKATSGAGLIEWLDSHSRPVVSSGDADDTGGEVAK